MTAWAEIVLDWIAVNPHLAGAITFLIAFVETLLIIGFFIPGTILLFGVGVLVGQGSVPLSIAAASLVIGGVAGDALGYWLGRHYRDWILELGFFKRRKRTIEFAERMIHRHTGKALLAARLIGQIRPIVPFVAGVADVRPVKFFIYNVLSAVIAAALHLIPGMIVGVGLRFSGAVTGRLVVLLVIVGVVAYLVYALAKRARALSILVGPGALERLSAWTHAEATSRWLLMRYAARGLVYLLDRERLELLGFATLWAVMLALLAGLIVLIRAVVAGDPIANANGAVFDALNGLRNPWADSAMVVVAALGEIPVILALSGMVLVALLIRRSWFVATYWVLATGFAFASTSIITMLAEGRVADAEPFDVADVLPQGHAAISVTVFGYLAILATQRTNSIGLRLSGFAAAFAFVSLLSIAQLYLGQSYVSGLAGGIIIGITALLILTAATWRHLSEIGRGVPTLVGWVGLIALLAAGAINIATSYDARIASLQPKDRLVAVAEQAWAERLWLDLLAYRVDFTGQPEEPINVQLAATVAEVVAALEPHGWRIATKWDAVTVADLVTGSTPKDFAARPVLPRFWEGRRARLIMVKLTESGRHVLHLWDLGYRLDGKPDAPLLLGTVERELYRENYLDDFIALPPGAGDFSAAANALAIDLAGSRLAVRGTGRIAPPARRPERAWDGSTVIYKKSGGPG